MSQPPIPPGDGPPPYLPPAAPPSWAQPWAPPPRPALPGPAPVAAPRSGNRTALVLVAVVAALLGAVVGGLVTRAAFVPSAHEVGAALAAAAAPGLEDTVSDGISKGMDDAVEDYGGFFEGPEDAYAPPPPDERFPPTEPGDLGPDPVLNAYAVGCFEGDLSACDDLYFEAPPMSDYEEYAVTCGGRIKAYMTQYCTDLE